MGVPDFLKFAVRSSPDCLVPVSQRLQWSIDFVLVDATNVVQTIGFDHLFDLLVKSSMEITTAVIFAVDSQRDRSGTPRQHRQSRVPVGDLDVKVEEFCVRFKSAKKDAQRPLLLISGRSVAGEADYKILDVQRTIVSYAVFHEKPLPSFLFVSEDSDILCGALCGPAPHLSYIATSLHDTTFRLNLLRVSHIATYVAACVDALVAPEEGGQMTVSEELLATDPASAQIPLAVRRDPLENEEKDIVRRKKKDGPMVSTGTREVLSSSSDTDDDEVRGFSSVEEKVSKKGDPVESRVAEGSTFSQLSSLDLSAAWITHSSCVDLVFLFQLIMGNGAEVPPLVRGVTKIDIQSCWSSYCRKKYEQTASLLGKNLVHLSSNTAKSSSDVVVALDTSFLHSILESVHYTDCISRPPVDEEKERALAFLSSILFGTLRYVVGCNLLDDANSEHSTSRHSSAMLDSRPATSEPPISPSLAAIMVVLGSSSRLEFPFSLSEAVGGSSIRSKDSVVEKKTRVCSHLACPRSSFSWAVRGNGSTTIEDVLRRTLLRGVACKQRSVAELVFQSTVKNVRQLKNRPEEYPVPVGTLAAVVTCWALTVGTGVDGMRKLGTHTRFVSPSTGKIVVGPVKNGPQSSGNLNTETAREGAAHMTYSFELRRMVPVMDEETTIKNRPSPSLSEEDGNSSGHRLLEALGVSLSYGATPSRLVPLAPDTDQIAQPPQKKRRTKESGSEGRDPSVKLSASAESKDTKKKSRPGKKERMKRRASDGQERSK